MPSDNRKRESAPNSHGYLTLDVANLSLIATAGEHDFVAGPRTPVKKTFSRKGSQRGGERKPPDSAVAVAAGAEKLDHLVHVVDCGEEGSLHLGTTTTPRVAVGDGRFRRLAFRRQPPCIDPQRVLVLFATLSSVGTLILLYFTLFTGNITGGDGNVG